MKICPKCGYERTDKDNITIPHYECPKCGVIYSKIKQKNSLTHLPPESTPLTSPINESSGLSIEEQKKIYEEEKFRVEAKAKAEREHKIAQEQQSKSQIELQQTKGCLGCLLICGVISLILVMISIFSGNTENNYSSSSYKSYSPPTTAKQWYEGGTLHYATVNEWQNASYTNKIATAADWVASSPKGKSVFNETRNINSLKPYVFNLIDCVDNATSGAGYGDMKINEIAASCIILMGYNY